MLYDKFVDASGAFAQELGFLARAVSYDETRPFMRQIFVEPSETGGLKGAAVDGLRLHIVDPLDGAAGVMGLTPGFWRVLKTAKKNAWISRLDEKETNDWKFPAYQRIIPAEKAEYETVFEGFAFSGGRYTKHSELARFIHDFPDATAINLRYLADLGTGTEWKVEWYGSTKAVKFTGGGRMAVIMPMQID